MRSSSRFINSFSEKRTELSSLSDMLRILYGQGRGKSGGGWSQAFDATGRGKANISDGRTPSSVTVPQLDAEQGISILKYLKTLNCPCLGQITQVRWTYLGGNSFC